MQKNYYAIIPANVRYDEKLTDGAKLLYGEITALSNEKGYCWASNGYFAKLYSKDRSTIKRWIKQLEERGYIERKVKYKKGGGEIETRYMQICAEGRGKNEPTPRVKSEPDNTTSINNTFNTTDEIPYVEIINYLNDVAEKNYRSTTRKTKDLIKARWNEGFKLDDFKKVIDTKSAEWKNSEKWSKFIRPDTLFGPKFEGYLNQDGIKQTNSEYDDLF